jgi:hypothetical protein
MKVFIMKVIKLLCIPFVFGTINCSAQKKITNPSFSYSHVTSENLADALRMLNVDIFNIELPIPYQKKYILSIYLDEYGKDSLIKHQELGWGETIENRTPKTTINKLAIIIHKENENKLFTTLKTSSGGERGINVNKDEQYNLPHVCKQFKSQELLPEKKIPVLLYGSMWHDSNIPADAVRFCMENQLDADFSSEAFKKMPHYYLFSIELKELK